MEGPINFGLNSLPRELLHIIYSYLSLEDQIATMPKVSRIWRSVSEESKNLFNELSKRFLKCCVEEQNFNQDQINIIIKLFKTYNFISKIKVKSVDCRLRHCMGSITPAKIVSEKKELKNLTLSGHRNHDGYSKSFYIHWNPNTLKLSIKKGEPGDFQTSFSIRIDTSTLSYQRKNLFKSVALHVPYHDSAHKKDFISWKWISEEEIEPQKMNRLIKSALELQLKMHNLYLTNLNMIALSKINHIEDIPSELRFPCNKNGRIVANNSNFFLILKIKNLDIFGQNMPILTWKSSDHHEDKEKSCKITDLMRWSVFLSTCEKLAITDLMRLSVFSSTCEKLAEKLGIRIKESH